MPQRTGPSNPGLQKLIEELRGRGFKENSDFMLAVADGLAKPSRNRAGVNVSELERTCKAKEDVIIPGKLLADGKITKQVSVACFSSSEAARKKVEGAGGKIISIGEMVEKNPKGTGVRIMC